MTRSSLFSRSLGSNRAQSDVRPPELPPEIERTAQPAPRSLSSAIQRGDTCGDASVITEDFVMRGENLHLMVRGRLLINGIIDGDVCGENVEIGETGAVTGDVFADRLDVRGTLTGNVDAKTVLIRARARVAAEITHDTLTIEEGAEFDGRSRRSSDPSRVTPDFDGFARARTRYARETQAAPVALVAAE